MARFDRLENKLETLISKVIDEVNNGNRPKDLPLNEFFFYYKNDIGEEGETKYSSDVGKGKCTAQKRKEKQGYSKP